MVIIKANDVAEYILFLHKDFDKSKGYNPNSLMTNLRLQKYIFFAQVLYIHRFGEKLFDAPMEAWLFGPVVRDVYSYYSRYGSLDIEDKPKSFPTTKYESEKLQVIEDIYRDFKPLENYKLIELSHQHPLWLYSWNHHIVELPIDRYVELFNKDKQSL